MKELGKIITLQTVSDPRGNLTIAEENKNLPFDLKRAYWITDVPKNGSRGGHAHKRLRQVLIAVHGSFTVTLDNGKETKTYLLNNPGEGLLIDTEIWRTLDDFSSGAVCLVLASELYEPEDYLYEYNDFIEYVHSQHSTMSASRSTTSEP